VPAFLPAFLPAVALLATACGDGTAGTAPGRLPVPPVGGPFTLATGPATLAVLRGGAGERTITLARAGFRGAVSFAVTGAPAGVTATVVPSTTFDTTATLEVVTTPEADMGTVALTITATALDQPTRTATVTLGLSPSTGGAGNVTVDFSTCLAAERPVWFAYQDGTGAWTQILGASDVYRFNVASPKGGYVYAAVGAGRTLSVALATQAELTRATARPCATPAVGPKTVSGTVRGLPATGLAAYVGLGGPNPDPHQGPITPTFSLTGIQAGPQDLIAYRRARPELGPTERAIIRRDQNLPDRGTLDPIDFDAAEAFAPATARIAVTGAGGVPIRYAMLYYTGASCARYDLYNLFYEDFSGTDFLVGGIPAARQRPTDFHQVAVYASTGNATRSASESFRTLAARTVALPAALPTPRITVLPGGHKRLQATLTLPSEYQRLQLSTMVGLSASGPTGYAYVDASSAWLGGFGGSDVTLAFPDFSGVTGWQRAFLAPTTEPGGWWGVLAAGTNDAAAASPCAENARFVYAGVNGRN
jgi:hypothetical protein